MASCRNGVHLPDRSREVARIAPLVSFALLIAGVAAVAAEPPIAPALVLFGSASVAAVAGAVAGKGSRGIVALNGVLAIIGALALLFIWGLMNSA